MRMDIVSCLWEQNPLSIDDVAAMVAGQIGQLTPMDEETADLFKQLAKKTRFCVFKIIIGSDFEKEKL